MTDKESLTVQAMTAEGRTAQESVCDEILSIMEEYHRQDERGYVDTPGGLEHMGDVWSQLLEWEQALLAAPQAEPTAWLHEITEPNRDTSVMLSLSADNPWSHWVEAHRDRCKYKVTPLYADKGPR